MIQFANQEQFDAHKKEQKARIYNTYTQSDARKTATLITKAELDEQYPADKFERYSLQAVHKFREDLIKAEGIDDKDAAFREAVKDLKSFIVQHDGKKAIMFVREKEKGE